jgi:hypothetical protein
LNLHITVEAAPGSRGTIAAMRSLRFFPLAFLADARGFLFIAAYMTFACTILAIVRTLERRRVPIRVND